MNEMKYIIVDSVGLHLPYLFPVTVNHSDMVRALSLTAEKVVSAGTVRVRGDGHLSVINGSVTLGKVFSRKRTDDDIAILEYHLCNE